MEISGTIGPCNTHNVDVVTSIVFTTNVRSYGPFGRVVGIRFHSPPMRNGSIVGFFVNAGDVIDAIGVYFSPERETIKNEVHIYIPYYVGHPSSPNAL
jgi:hypothetical protein